MNKENLKLALKQNGYKNLTEFSIDSGISYSTLKVVVKGNDTKLSTAKRIASALNVSLDFLFKD